MSFNSFLLNMFSSFVRPGRRAELTADVIYGLTTMVSPRKKVALQNLDIVFPDKDTTWKEKIVKRSYRHLALSLTEYFCLVKKPDSVEKYVTSITGESILEDLVKEGRGAVILAAHVGNWELLAAWLGIRGYPLRAVARDPNDEDVARLLNDFRKKTGVETIPKKRVMAEAVRSAREGAFIGLVADQDGGRSGIRLPFLGRECSVAAGPASISVLADIPIVPVVSYRIEPFRHEVIIGPVIGPSYIPDKKEKIKKLTESCGMEMERMVLAHPEQWLWFHRRWRE